MRFLVSIVYLAYRLVEKFVIVYTFVFLKKMSACCIRFKIESFYSSIGLYLRYLCTTEILMAKSGSKILWFFRRGRWLRMASLYVRHPDRLMQLAKRVRGYMSKEGLRELGTLLLLLWHYVLDVAQGKYKNYNRQSLILIVAALIYLVSPVDFVPDILPGGLVDDACVLLYVVNSVRDELSRYRGSRRDDDEHTSADNKK